MCKRTFLRSHRSFFPFLFVTHTHTHTHTHPQPCQPKPILSGPSPRGTSKKWQHFPKKYFLSKFISFSAQWVGSQQFYHIFIRQYLLNELLLHKSPSTPPPYTHTHTHTTKTSHNPHNRTITKYGTKNHYDTLLTWL